MVYNVYMEGVDKDGLSIEGTLRNLETDFKGLRYIRAKGINDIGEPKNIYTEDYADSHSCRVYVPEDITNKSTTIVLELIFIGEKKQDVYDTFNEYIRHGRHKFWDDVRNKSFVFVVTDEVKVEEEEFKNGEPYIKATYTLKNLQGLSTKIVK